LVFEKYQTDEELLFLLEIDDIVMIDLIFGLVIEMNDYKELFIGEKEL